MRPWLIASFFDIGHLGYEDFKLEKGPTDKAKEPDPGGSDQQNLGYKKLKNRKTDRTVGLNYCISNISGNNKKSSLELLKLLACFRQRCIQQ